MILRNFSKDELRALLCLGFEIMERNHPDDYDFAYLPTDAYGNWRIGISASKDGHLIMHVDITNPNAPHISATIDVDITTEQLLRTADDAIGVKDR